MLRVEELPGDLTTKVALVMAPLLPWIRTGVGNIVVYNVSFFEKLNSASQYRDRPTYSFEIK